MGLIIPISGAYAGTFTPAGGAPGPIGLLTDDGFELSVSPKGQEVNQTDQFGMTLLDVIALGADWRIRYRSKEWNYSAQQMAAHYPFGIGATFFSPRLGAIGRRYSDLAGSLGLTGVAGTPATLASAPATLTAAQAIVSPNVNLASNFTSKLRELPIEQILLPYDDMSGNVMWFTTT